MQVLYFLEGIRNPFLDAFFSVVTMLGEETFFILLAIFLFWCVDKKQGFYMLAVGFTGIVVNQFLKIFCRVPRPWVKDPNFTIVESARAEATGYSFPSGHTQGAVGAFGALARWNRNWILRVISVAFCVLVPLSRMYLGVHTPLDVGVSIVIASALIFGLYPLLNKCFENKKVMRILFSCMVGISLALVVYTNFSTFPQEVDRENLRNAAENAYKMLGCTLGMLITYEVDARFIDFQTGAKPLTQVVKYVLGMVPVMMIKTFLDAPLYALFQGNCVADGVRYLLIVLFVGCVWPLTFPLIKKLLQK